MVRMLLKILAYDNQNQSELLPDKWEIEHIFPQKWDTSFFTLDSDETNKHLSILVTRYLLKSQ